MAKILLVHQNFPGQFANIAHALQARGDTVVALGGPRARQLPGIALVRWSTQRGTTAGIFVPAVRAEADFIRGEAALTAAAALADRGFTPDVIIVHPGWGEGLFLKELWPAARMILFGELLYRTSGGDIGFDPELGGADLPERVRVHAKNASQLLAYAFADAIVCPTRFQASTFPQSLQHLIRVIHEGVDVQAATRRSDARVKLGPGLTLDSSRPVITYVSRTLEPQRGFHIFMRALPQVLEVCPGAEVLIVGDPDRTGYGAPRSDGRSWKTALLEELGNALDLTRVHFTGSIAHSSLIDMLSISWAHIYYTSPFVLSWSLVEAMACECLVIASDTAPVRDAIEDGENGLLLPYFDIPRLSETIVDVIENQPRFDALRHRARERILADFDAKKGTAMWVSAVDELLR